MICHDLTQIIKDKTKDARFRKGHIVTREDIPVLLDMGKEHLYVWENRDGMLHEDDAAQILYEVLAGTDMAPSEVREGKIDVIAKCDGLFDVDKDRLFEINSIGEIMAATRHGGFPVKAGDKLAGARVIPLVIAGDKLEEARAVGAGKPLLTLTPFQKGKKVGIVTTGSEILNGRIKDTFMPVLKEKIEEYGAVLTHHELTGDDGERITKAVTGMMEDGDDMVLCSGGMSVDPDDATPLAIRNTGAEVVSYGAPVLPGAMFMLAYYNGRPVIGLPGCAMYAKRTIFDLILPRLMANVKITAEGLADLGHGGLCLNCESCTYPNCGFGKG